MANVLNKNPMVVDTLSASALLTDDLYIRGMYVQFGDTAVAGDQVTVQDAAGNNVWDVHCTGAREKVFWMPTDVQRMPMKIVGLKVPTLTAGHGTSLFIYLA